MQHYGVAPRRRTVTVDVGGVKIGSAHPVVVQSMTNTDTADVQATVAQIKQLADAGSEIVRITVNNDEAAQAVPAIVRKLRADGYTTPIVGDFHYNGHLLLTRYPECAEALDKYRINPGNVGTKRQDENFRTIIEQAIKYGKPVRIGVNWGSLDQQLLTEMMDENARSADPQPARTVMILAMIESALRSARFAEECGLGHDRIVISAKVSAVQDLVEVYQRLAKECDYPLHLGLTEAGMGMKGIVASTAGLAILLQQGIGDTIRVSLTPSPGGDRTEEVQVRTANFAVPGPAQLHASGDVVPRMRPNDQHLLPGTGRPGAAILARADARLAHCISRRGGSARGGHGLRRERAGRKQARRHRDFAARHLRRACGPRVRGWCALHHTPRGPHLRRV